MVAVLPPGRLMHPTGFGRCGPWMGQVSDVMILRCVRRPGKGHMRTADEESKTAGESPRRMSIAWPAGGPFALR